MTITEAAACATPAVVTRIAGHTDAVVDGRSGLLALRSGPQRVRPELHEDVDLVDVVTRIPGSGAEPHVQHVLAREDVSAAHGALDSVEKCVHLSCVVPARALRGTVERDEGHVLRGEQRCRMRG